MKKYKIIEVDGFFSNKKQELGEIESQHDLMVGDYISLKGKRDLRIRARELEGSTMLLFVRKE